MQRHKTGLHFVDILWGVFYGTGALLAPAALTLQRYNDHKAGRSLVKFHWVCGRGLVGLAIITQAVIGQTWLGGSVPGLLIGHWRAAGTLWVLPVLPVNFSALVWILFLYLFIHLFICTCAPRILLLSFSSFPPPSPFFCSLHFSSPLLSSLVFASFSLRSLPHSVLSLSFFRWLQRGQRLYSSQRDKSEEVRKPKKYGTVAGLHSQFNNMHIIQHNPQPLCVQWVQ